MELAPKILFPSCEQFNCLVLNVGFLFNLKLSDEPSQLQRSPHRNRSRWGRRSWHSASNVPALWWLVMKTVFMCTSITMDLIWQVKPGLPYLDIIRLLRDNSALPIAAYQVSSLAHPSCSEVFPSIWSTWSCSLFEVEVWCQLPMILLDTWLFNPLFIALEPLLLSCPDQIAHKLSNAYFKQPQLSHFENDHLNKVNCSMLLCISQCSATLLYICAHENGDWS